MCDAIVQNRRLCKRDHNSTSPIPPHGEVHLCGHHTAKAWNGWLKTVPGSVYGGPAISIKRQDDGTFATRPLGLTIEVDQ